MLVGCYTLMGVQQAKAQLPSDAAEYSFNVSEVTNLIQSSLLNPTPENEYVSYIKDESGFPAINDLASETFKKNLELWVKSNPQAIEQLLIRRKKNYDKFHNQETKQ